MKNFEMCVAYRLQSENLQLFYERNSESLLCVKNICEECNSPWYHSINQCVFCGTENYFIWICYKCNKKVSLTNANPHIGGCGHNSLLKLCFNKDCVSRKDNKVHKIILKNMKLGLFEKDGSARSGFTISQQFCKCGAERNCYKQTEIKVLQSQNIKEDYEKYKNDFDVIIFVNENLNEFITTTKNNYNTKYKSDIDIEKII